MIRGKNKAVSGIAVEESYGTMWADRITEAQELSQKPRHVLSGYDNGSVANALAHFRFFLLIELLIQSVRERPQAHTFAALMRQRPASASELPATEISGGFD